MTEAEREFISLIIGHRVRQVRRSRRMSQEALAQGVGSQSMISLIEGGHQLPLPDVMWTLAHRLNDPILENYAKSLEDNTLRYFSVSYHNEEDLLSILKHHRGRWHPAHERIALQLCQHYYATRNMEQVQELCELIIHHVSHNSVRAEAYFYLGSSHLQQHRFKDGEYWLSQAEELFDYLTDSIKGRLSYNLGYAFTYLDIQVLALWYASRAVDIFNRSHDFLSQGNAMGLLGTIQTRLGRWKEAKASLTIGLDIMQRWGNSRGNEARVMSTLSEVCLLLNQDEEALSHVTVASEIVDDEDFLCKADIYRIFSQLALKAGNIEQAREQHDLALSAARISGDPHSLGQTYLLGVQLFPTDEEKMNAARLSFEATQNTNHHILHALSAECMAGLSSTGLLNGDEIAHYSQSALESYRTYVHKNSMFTHLIDSLPLRSERTNAKLNTEINDETVDRNYSS